MSELLPSQVRQVGCLLLLRVHPHSSNILLQKMLGLQEKERGKLSPRSNQDQPVQTRMVLCPHIQIILELLPSQVRQVGCLLLLRVHPHSSNILLQKVLGLQEKERGKLSPRSNQD